MVTGATTYSVFWDNQSPLMANALLGQVPLHNGNYIKLGMKLGICEVQSSEAKVTLQMTTNQASRMIIWRWWTETYWLIIARSKST
jgi:hypothetical protein